jgi:transcriptional regulator of acetoin/glycerol metabolism
VQSLDALTSAAVREALAQAGGNVTQAARLLGISRSTLYRKLRDTPGA